METISELLITHDAGSNLEFLQQGIKASFSDPKTEVRRTAQKCVGHLLKYLAPKYIKQYEATLVSYLRIGLND